MLLRPIQKPQYWSQIKAKLFDIEYSLVHALEAPSLSICLALSIFSMLPSVSILFKEEKFFDPSQITQLSKIFIFSEAAMKLGIGVSFFEIITVLYLSLLMVGVVWIGIAREASVVKVTAMMLNIFVFLAVPFCDSVLSLITNSQNPLLQIFSAWLLIMVASIGAIYLKLNIKPLRKNNREWFFSNEYATWQFILELFKALIIFVDGPSFVGILLFLLAELVKKYWFQSEFITCKFRTLCNNVRENMLIAIYGSMLISKLFRDQEFAAKLLIASLALMTVKTFHSYFQNLTGKIEVLTCKDPGFKFYHFYYVIKEEYFQCNNTKYANSRELEKEVVWAHCKKCTEPNCCFRQAETQTGNFLEYLFCKVERVLEQRQYGSLEDQLLFQIWQFESGNKLDTEKRNQKLPLSLKYVVFASTHNNKEMEANLETVTNKSVLNEMFFKHMKVILVAFLQLYSELLKSQPKIEVIAQAGSDIKKNVVKLNCLYNEMLKKNSISFQLIEFYLEFEKRFLKNDSMNCELYRRIKKVQKSVEKDQIDEVHMPTLTFDPQSGSIVDANMSCVKFLKLSRFQIRSKRICELVHPLQNVEKFGEMTPQEKDRVRCFTSKNNSSPQCVKIHLSTTMKDQKRLNSLSFEAVSSKNGENFILIDRKFEILETICQVSKISRKRHRQDTLTLQWRNTFEEHIKPRKADLMRNKVLKVDLAQLNSQVSCTMFSTLNMDNFVLNLKLSFDQKEDHGNSRRSVIRTICHEDNQRKQYRPFVFSYENLMNDQLILLGQHQSSEKQKSSRFSTQTKSLDVLVRKVEHRLVKGTIINPWIDGKMGIKTYRLFGNELYNVDLEDKEAYVEEFSQLEHDRLKGTAQSEFNKAQSGRNEFCVMALVILLALLLTSLSLALLLEKQSALEVIKEEYVRTNQIEQFKIRFFQIMSIFRDVASGLYEEIGRDWRKDVEVAYNEMAAKRSSTMFSNGKDTIFYVGKDHGGSLNELIDLVTSGVYSILKEPLEESSFQLIEEIHEAVINQLTEMVDSDQELHNAKIEDRKQWLLSFEVLIIVLLALGTAIYYLCMTCLTFSIFSQVKAKLKELMVLSDGEAKLSQKNSEQFLFAIDMIEKNYEFDLKSLETPQKHFRKRNKSKELYIGTRLKALLIAVSVFCFISHISVLVLFDSFFSQQLKTFDSMVFQGKNIMGVYGNLCKQTNEIQHTGVVIKQRLQFLKLQLVYVERSRNELSFSEETNRRIINYFFEDSCPWISESGYFAGEQILTCEQATPGYKITNPFTIGLDLFLTRSHYNILDDIQDTFASTGIYSNSFAQVFTELSINIQSDGEEFLNNFFVESSIWSTFIISINVLYCIVAFCFSLYGKKKTQELEKVVKFLKINQKVKNSTSKQQSNE